MPSNAEDRSTRSVRAIEDKEVFQTTVSADGTDNSQLICHETAYGSKWTQERSALDMYKKATKDDSLSEVQPVRQTTTAYRGSELNLVGRTRLHVRRGDIKCRLDCKIVDQQGIRPLLGCKACLGMNIVAYLQLNKPNTGKAEVYTVEDEGRPVTKEQLMQKKPNSVRG